MRRATVSSPFAPSFVRISIHALRKEGDLLVTCQQVRNIIFLPTPSARRATLDPNKATHTTEFLPTPSARRATQRHGRHDPDAEHFYPRPPRGGRPPRHLAVPPGVQISTHALREEGDAATVSITMPKAHFYPRPPRGGRPYNWSVGVSDYLISPPALREEGDLRLQDVPELYAISTHALREEGDVMSMPSCVEIGNFYPRPPRGGRQMDKERGFE